MNIPKGIPRYELENLTQSEFWKFEKDNTCVGLPGQKVPALTFVELLLLNADRARDKREAVKIQDVCFDKLTESPVKQEQLASRIMWPKQKHRTHRFIQHQIEPFNPFYYKTKEGKPYYGDWEQDGVNLSTAICFFIESSVRLAQLLPEESIMERTFYDSHLAWEVERGDWD